MTNKVMKTLERDSSIKNMFQENGIAITPQVVMQT